MVLIPYMLVRILDDMTDFVDQDYWGDGLLSSQIEV